MSKPIIAIVGRPNVGKSTLFNKLTGKRLAIVEDTPGVTRDRIYSECEWLNHTVMLIDTGGIEPKTDDGMLAKMRDQANIAIESADVIILVSSVHGHGTGDLLDECFKFIDFDKEDEYDEDAVKVAIIGKPNVGKSSLVNRIAGEERVIVSNVAGTTRDATDTEVENQYGKFVLIDTAGIRRKSRVDDNVEKYSVLRSYMAVDRSDVCVIMIDATEGFTEQDSKVAGYAHEQGKACVIAVNKWDAIEKDGNTMNKFQKELEVDFSFMSYAPIVFISALTGQRIDKLFEQIVSTHEQNCRRISTGMLNDMLSYATAKVQPPSDKGKRLKLYYMTQASTRPPTFVVFCNRSDLFHFSYQRYIENQIRETFGLNGTPIKIVVRERGKDKG